MTNTQELRTVYTMDTRDADRGVQRVERAFERLGAAEKKAMNDRSQREAARAEQEAVRRRERAINDLERIEKEASDRRVAATRAEYQRLDKLERDRQQKQALSMRLMQGATGIGPSAGQRAAGGGGFFADGNNRRIAGDAINMAAGSSGWVMKLNALAHFGVRMGGVGAVGAMMAKGYSAHERMREGTDGLRGALGERVNNSWHENPLTKGMVHALPLGLRHGFFGDPYKVARGDMQSVEGMGGQRQEIQEELKKAQDSRGYWSSFAKTISKPIPGLGRHMQRREDQSFEAELRAQDKLLQLDSKIAEKTQAKTAAQRMGALESEKEGRLAENRLAMEERIKELNDANRAGKIGDGERVSGIRAAQSERELADADVNLRARAQWRGVMSQRELTYIGRRGEDVEQRSAASRLKTAESAQGDARTEEEKAAAAAAVDAARLEYEWAEKSTRERKTSLAIDREVANFRGGAEARTRNAAEQALRKEKELLAIAKERGADAEREAQVRVSAAELTLALTKRELAARRIGDAADIERSGLRTASSRMNAGLRTDSQDENVRFAAGQASALDRAKTGVSIAEKDLKEASDKVANERASQNGKASVSAIKEQTLAQDKLNIAKDEQVEVEKQLSFQAAERKRALKAEMDAARNETAAMRMENAGRGDRAAVMRGRSETAAQALEFQRQGRPGMAEEVQQQQRQREVGAYLDKYTRPDGRRRSRSEINREERTARKLEQRRGRRIAELERNGGLINVRRDIGGNVIGGMDPLTREKVTAEQLYDRKQQPARQAAKERDEGTKTFNDIYSILNERLPKETR